MANYSPEELKQIVEELQKRAAGAPIYGAWYGVALGSLVLAWWFISGRWVFFSASGAILGGILGFQLGRMRALSLHAQAQSLLCQMQIEENTRR